MLKAPEADEKTPWQKKVLAELRNSIGRQPLSLSVLGLLFEQIAPEYQSNYGEFNALEASVLLTLQIFSVVNQGTTFVEMSSKDDETARYKNFGYSLRSLKTEDNAEAFDRRFNILITSTNSQKFKHHLLQLVKLLKGYKQRVEINFPLLAADIYQFFIGRRNEVRVAWSRQYFRKPVAKEEGEKNE